MAGDKEQFKRAVRKWEELKRDENFSAPSDTGRVAILWSDASFYDEAANQRAESEEFEREADRIRANLLKRCVAATILPRVKFDDVCDVLRDKTVSDVVMIGNGGLDAFLLDQHRKAWMTWRDVSNEADHLKTGVFMQRFCGNLYNGLNVPFGTFAVSDHRSVLAAVGVGLPMQMRPQDEALIRPVHDEPQLSYQKTRELFPLVNTRAVSQPPRA